MSKGIMPKGLNGLLRWYAEGWDAEVPTTLHKAETWYGRDRDGNGQTWPAELTGGSHLGTRAHTESFRRYIEEAESQCDPDGYYVRPMHAALSRLGRRWPLTARALFAVAQSGFDWRGVAERGHWPEEMFCLFAEQALARLWTEYRDQVVRLT